MAPKIVAGHMPAWAAELAKGKQAKILLSRPMFERLKHKLSMKG